MVKFSLNSMHLFLLIIFSLLSTNQTIYAANKGKPTPPDIKATGYILVDFNSGQVLLEKNADQKMEPASLTKMMSAYVVFSEIKKGDVSLSDMTTISKKAWRMKGSRMFLEAGKRVSVEELIKGMVVQSGNDATIALAEHVAGSEEDFVIMMNEYAKQMGLIDTHFYNSTGLPHSDHYTTPRDMATLGKSIISDFPNHYRTFSIKVYKYNKIEQKNRNRLLWSNKYVDGIKTGHTESAGYCLVASAMRGKMRLISVVLGTKSKKARERESHKLITYGFRFYETHKLYAAKEPLTNVRIWKGQSQVLPLGLTEDLFITIPKGEYKNLDASMSINAEIVAPVSEGNTYGTVNITLGSKNYAVRKLIALTDIPAGSFIQNIIDTIKLAFK